MKHLDRVAAVDRVEVMKIYGVEEIGLELVNVTANAFTFPVLSLKGCDSDFPYIPCILVKSNNKLTMEAKLALCEAKSNRVESMYKPTEEALIKCKLADVVGLSAAYGVVNSGYLVRVPAVFLDMIGKKMLESKIGVNVTRNNNEITCLVDSIIKDSKEELDRLWSLHEALAEVDAKYGKYSKYKDGYGFWLSKFYEALEVGVMDAQFTEYSENNLINTCIINNLIDTHYELEVLTIDNDFPHIEALRRPLNMNLDVYVDSTRPIFYDYTDTTNRESFYDVVSDIKGLEFDETKGYFQVRVLTKAYYSDVKRGLYGKQPVSLDVQQEYKLRGNQDVVVEYNYYVNYENVEALQNILLNGYDFCIDFELYGVPFNAPRFTLV